MYLEHLEVAYVRNLQNVTLLPHPRINFIIGKNGSGKTSLLESIALLSMGKSFRSPDIKKVISKGLSKSTVFGKANNGIEHYSLGIQRSTSGDTRIKLNGTVENKMSVLAKTLPTIAIESNSLLLIEGGPVNRRNALDWGVMFHVEHDFLNLWHRFRKACSQRSALLKMQKYQAHKHDESLLRYWENVFVQTALPIHHLRMEYVKKLEAAFIHFFRQYFDDSVSLSLKYKSGWNTEKWPELSDCLRENRQIELERLRCLYGPHRADFEIHWEGYSAKDFCSRGQKKLLLYGVRLAQAELMMSEKSIYPVLLLDDLPAELDKKNLESIVRFIHEFPCQAFITATDSGFVTPLKTILNEEFEMFHVEHGCVTS